MRQRVDNRAKELGLSDHEFQLVRNLCRKFVNSRDSMDDMLQVALIGLAEAFNRYSWFPDIDSAIEDTRLDISYRPAFIYRVVINTLVRTIKKSRNDVLYNAHPKSLPLDDDPSYDEIDSESFKCPGASIFISEDTVHYDSLYPNASSNDGIETAESRLFVEHLLGCLENKDHRRIMYLFLCEGRSRSEIAEIVGIPRGRVGRIVLECLELLREEYLHETDLNE